MFTNEQAAAYLAAMIDGEGTIAHYYSKGATRSRHVMVSNTDTSIIKAVIECCEILDITCTVKDYSRYHKKGNKLPEFRVHIYGHINLCRIRDLVPIRSLRKQEKLEECINSFERSMKRRTQGCRSFASMKGGE